ncbi:MAG: dipeptide epimerase, partial [Rudaea sp.]
MPALALGVATEKLKLAAPFRISGYVFEAQDAVVVTLGDGSHRGRGEASGVYYLGDNLPEMVAAIEGQRATIEAGIDRTALQEMLPPGGARNALDCALWDLEAHR